MGEGMGKEERSRLSHSYPLHIHSIMKISAIANGDNSTLSEIEVGDALESYDQLREIACAQMGIEASAARLQWQDDEDDWVVLSSEEDMKEAHCVVESMPSQTLLLDVSGPPCASKPEPLVAQPQQTTREVRILEVGPLWGQAHAVRVAEEYVATHPGHHFTGHWWTTVPGKMSVLQLSMPSDNIVESWRPAVVEPDPTKP